VKAGLAERQREGPSDESDANDGNTTHETAAGYTLRPTAAAILPT
jgi:hypothetical protein